MSVVLNGHPPSVRLVDVGRLSVQLVAAFGRATDATLTNGSDQIVLGEKAYVAIHRRLGQVGQAHTELGRGERHTTSERVDDSNPDRM